MGLYAGQVADWVRRPLSFYQARDPNSLPDIALKYTRRDENRWPAAFRELKSSLANSFSATISFHKFCERHLSSLLFMHPVWTGDDRGDSAKSLLSPNGQASTLKFSSSVGFCRK